MSSKNGIKVLKRRMAKAEHDSAPKVQRFIAPIINTNRSLGVFFSYNLV